MSWLTIEILSTVFNFSVVLFILWHFGRKPIGDFFGSRSQTIAAQVSEARTEATLAQTALKEWESKKAGSVREMETHRKDAEATVARFREAALARSHAEAERIAEEAAAMNVSEALRARRGLRRTLALESLAQARHYLTNHIDKKDAKRLVGEYLERVSDEYGG